MLRALANTKALFFLKEELRCIADNGGVCEMLVWRPLFEHPCCNAKGDVYAKARLLRVDDGTLEDALYDILKSIEEFTGMVTVKFFENGKLYNTIDIPMSNDLLKKFDDSQLKSSVLRIKLIRYIDDVAHIDIQINVIR